MARPSDLGPDLAAINIIAFALLKPLTYSLRVLPLLDAYTLATLANR